MTDDGDGHFSQNEPNRTNLGWGSITWLGGAAVSAKRSQPPAYGSGVT
jgi:hypothetical protein